MAEHIRYGRNRRNEMRVEMIRGERKLAVPSVDNAGRPYVALFRQSIDAAGRVRRRCSIVNCATVREAGQIARAYR
jgi:hypothetical protein